MKNKLLLISLGVFACFAAPILSAHNVSAEASGLNVLVHGDQPKRFDGLLEPGKTYSSVIDVENKNDEVATVTVTPKPLSYIPFEGDYIPDHHAETHYTQLSKWLVFPEGTEYDIAPKESIAIRYEFTVPDKAPTGTQAAIIQVHTVTEEEKNSSSGIAAEISFGYTIFASVDGADLKEEGRIISWEINGFSFAPPVRASTMIENTGNMGFSAKHDLEFYPLFSDRDPVFTDTQELDVLPDSKRILFQSWHEAPLLGIFNAKETISFLGNDYEYSKVVIICPLWLLILFGIILALIITIIVRRVRARKATPTP